MNAIAQAMEPERVGRLSCERAPIEEAADYRVGALQKVRLRLIGDRVPEARKSRGWIMPLVLILAGLLLLFAFAVRSAPAIATVSMVMSALGLLVLRSRTSEVPVSAEVILDQETLRWTTDFEPGLDSTARSTRPISELESVGIGEDGLLSTVFVTVCDEGRVMLLEGLTADEARAAAGWLGEELAHRLSLQNSA